MNKEFLEQLSELNREVKNSFGIIDSMLIDLMDERDIPMPSKKIKRSFFDRLFGRK